MTIKSDTSTLKIPAPSQPTAADFSAQWTQARLAYPLYAALATQFNFAPLPHPAGELPPIRPTREVFDAVLNFLAAVDEKVKAFQIRQLPPATLNANEESLRAFLHRQLKKADKTPPDRDKIDLLAVQYFALSAPEELYRKDIRIEDVAEVLKPVIPEGGDKGCEWCEPLDQLLQKIGQCESLRDMMEHGLLEQGRLLKETAGQHFYEPAALVAFCRFNFLLRRAFIRMLHADVTAVRHAALQLEAAGVKTVDCRRAGFSAAETTSQLIYYSENWKQPFYKDYTESSVNRAFEQLLALRADLEEAVSRVHPSAIPPALERGAGTGCETSGGQRSGEGRCTGASASGKRAGCAFKCASGEARRWSGGTETSRGKARNSSAESAVCERGDGRRFRDADGDRGNGKVPRSHLGAVDCGAAVTRAFDVHGGATGYKSAAVVVGSGCVRHRRRHRSGRPASRRGGSCAAGVGHGSAEAFGRRRATRLGTRACEIGSVLLPGTRGIGETREEYRSGGEFGHQHEAFAFVHRGSRKAAALIGCEFRGAEKLTQAGVLIISDDAEFTRELTARWQQERMAPDVTLATSDVWATAIGERHDVVIVGPLSDEITEALLEALAEQCASSVIFVSLNERFLAQVGHYHPNVVTIARREDWTGAVTAAAGEALGRSESMAEPDGDAEDKTEDRRCAALGRYMLEARPRWNNALTSVLGNADLLLLEPAMLPEAARDQIQAIQMMALRLNEIMQRFSTIDAELRNGETTSQAETYATDDAFAPAR